MCKIRTVWNFTSHSPILVSPVSSSHLRSIFEGSPGRQIKHWSSGWSCPTLHAVGRFWPLPIFKALHVFNIFIQLNVHLTTFLKGRIHLRSLAKLLWGLGSSWSDNLVLCTAMQKHQCGDICATALLPKGAVITSLNIQNLIPLLM